MQRMTRIIYQIMVVTTHTNQQIKLTHNCVTDVGYMHYRILMHGVCMGNCIIALL